MAKFKNKEVILNPGDLFIIDDLDIKGTKWKLVDGKRIGKVIFLSKRMKSMMGFLFSKNTFNTIDEIKKISNYEDIEFDKIVLYTAREIIEKDKHYSLVGYNSPVTKHEIELTRRRVANHIFLLDDEVKMCDDDDYNKYYEQGYGGYASVVDTLNHLESYRKDLYPIKHPLRINQ